MFFLVDIEVVYYTERNLRGVQIFPLEKRPKNGPRRPPEGYGPILPELKLLRRGPSIVWNSYRRSNTYLNSPGSNFEPIRPTWFLGSREAADYYFSVQASPIERLDMYFCSDKES